MPTITIKLTEEADKKAKLYQADNALVRKEQAINAIIEQAITIPSEKIKINKLHNQNQETVTEE